MEEEYMLVHVERVKVEKDDGHIMWLDVYYDMETLVEYFGVDKTLTMRVNADGTPKIYKPKN